jgi:hypothetical protein
MIYMSVRIHHERMEVRGLGDLDLEGMSFCGLYIGNPF